MSAGSSKDKQFVSQAFGTNLTLDQREAKDGTAISGEALRWGKTKMKGVSDAEEQQQLGLCLWDYRTSNLVPRPLGSVGTNWH